MTALARPLRIAHVVLDLHEGGLERLVVDLAQRLDAPEFESHVVCLRQRGRLADELPGTRVHVVAPGGGLAGMLFPRPLIAALRVLAPDVVHLHSGVWFKGARAARLAGVPVTVFTDHGRPWPDPLTARILDHLGSRQTTRTVAVSEALRDYLLRRLRVDPARTVVVRNAVRPMQAPDPASVAAARAALGRGAPLVLSVGRLDAVKAYDVLIRAMHRVRSAWKTGTPPRLVIVGEGPDRGRLEGVITALGMHDAVTLPGWSSDIRPELFAADIFVLCSDSEGTSVSLVEAMQAGRAILATAVGGNPAVLGPELASQLVPPQDPGALGDRLLALLGSPRERERLGGLAAARAAEAFDQGLMTSAYAKLYRTLTASVPRQRE